MSDNEIYLLIKYIKNVLWRAAKPLSYIEDARCLKVKENLLGTRCDDVLGILSVRYSLQWQAVTTVVM